jgi:hypothetical protein
LNAHWAFKPTRYGYEPPITDTSKANKQYTKNVQLQKEPAEESNKKTYTQHNLQNQEKTQLKWFAKEDNYLP